MKILGFKSILVLIIVLPTVVLIHPDSIDNLEFMNGNVNTIDRDEDDPYEKRTV